MARKLLGGLYARVDHGGEKPSVTVTALKTTPYYRNSDTAELFRTIRVFRSTENNFVFGQDYAEYFDSLDVGQSELIFDGAIEEVNER